MQVTRLRPQFRVLRFLAVLLAGSTSLPLSAQDDARIFTPNFRDQPLEEVIQIVFEATGRTIIPDPRLPPGTRINFYNQRAMNAEELWQAFLQILQSNGYAAIGSGGIWRLVPDASARTEASQLADASPQAGGTGAEVSTRYVSVENVPSQQLVAVLRPLMSTSIGNITAVPGTNTMVLTDRADNLQRIIDIVRVLDEESAQETEVIALQYAAAEDVTQKLTQLISSQAAVGGGVGMQAIPDERTNSVVLAGTPGQIERYRPIAQALDLPSNQGGGSQVRPLYYADAEELATNLQAQFGGAQVAESAETAADPTGGNITVWADIPTNSLVLSAPSQVLRDMLAIIDSLDIPQPQVRVQAIIVEMSDRRAAELGLTWLVGSEGGDQVVGLTNFSATTGGILSLSQVGNDGAPDAGLIRDGVTAVIGNLSDSGTSWAAVVSALQGDAQTNVLQMPELTVLNNAEASITVGQQVPFLTGQFTDTGGGGGGSVNPFSTIEREDVGTTLEIIPRINEGSGMRLEITQVISSISSSEVASDVITNNREIITQVFVEDGDILILGGLMDDQLRENEQKVPGLGNIPGLRWLFRAQNTERAKTSLMVFIHPTILRDGEAANRLSTSRYQLMLEEQLRRAEEPVSLMKDADRPTLPPLVAPPSVEEFEGQPPAGAAPVPTE
jgi:general secretion pathway protein D